MIPQAILKVTDLVLLGLAVMKGLAINLIETVPTFLFESEILAKSIQLCLK